MSEEMILSEESKRVLKQCFAQYDANGNGIIELSELPKALEFAGVCASREEMNFILQTFDTGNDGKIQIEELVNNWQVLAEHSVSGDELMDAFIKLDKKENGYITQQELKVYLSQAGEKWSLDEVNGLLVHLSQYDTDNDGKFSYPEFVKMYTANMYPFKKPKEYQNTSATERFHMEKKE